MTIEELTPAQREEVQMVYLRLWLARKRREAHAKLHPNARKTHCPYGHEYTPENTFTKYARGCRTCRREQEGRRPSGWVRQAARAVSR